MPQTDLSELKIDVVFDLPDGRRRVARVSDLRRQLRIAIFLPGEGFGEALYEWSGECDAEGRPVYR